MNCSQKKKIILSGAWENYFKTITKKIQQKNKRQLTLRLSYSITNERNYKIFFLVIIKATAEKNSFLSSTQIY